jgi:hypothetical protein
LIGSSRVDTEPAGEIMLGFVYIFLVRLVFSSDFRCLIISLWNYILGVYFQCVFLIIRINMTDGHFLIVAVNLILQILQLLVKLLPSFLILLPLFLNTFLQSFHLLQTCLVYQLIELVLLTQFSELLGLVIRGHVDLPLLLHKLVPRVPGWSALRGLDSGLKQFWITLFAANLIVF